MSTSLSSRTPFPFCRVTHPPIPHDLLPGCFRLVPLDFPKSGLDSASAEKSVVERTKKKETYTSGCLE